MFLYAAEKRRLSKRHHHAENRTLTLCKVLDMSHTLSNKLASDDVSLSTFDVSSVLDDVRVGGHSVHISDSNTDNMETLYCLRRLSGRPADYI